MSDTKCAFPGSENASLDSSPRATLLLVCLGLCAVATLSLAPFIGMLRVSLASVFSPATGGVEAEVFWQLRVPRVLTAFLAGCGLAVSGMAFQALFRNPLATPFTLGVASGASLGAAVTVRLGLAISLVYADGGVILIDEIDTGLHYSVMGDLWRLVVETAKQRDIQVFATTHSQDCVRGLAWLCDNYPDLKQEVSLQKIDPDIEKAVDVDGDGIILAVEQRIEVR